MTKLAPIALSLAVLTGGCSAIHSGTARQTPVEPALEADTTPAVACPWLDTEHYQPPVALPGAAAAAPPAVATHFVPGCAIIRFTVGADGTVTSSALRAASPLTAGPTALAALQQMRFQPAHNPKVQFIIRLGMQRDSAGHIAIVPQTRPRLMRFWDFG